MAGGPLAEHVVCLVCRGAGTLARATRVSDGAESDAYRCAQGHEFSIDWSGRPATEPQWPPPGATDASAGDPVERAEYDREMEHLARTRHIKPSRLVE